MPAQIRSKSGRIVYLRVHEVGTKFGPPHDQLDAEVIVRFENDGPRAYGFPLRNDNNLPAAQAMFALLQDAFNAHAAVTVDYKEEELRNHYQLLRVIRTA
jgi:hypothetical protein